MNLYKYYSKDISFYIVAATLADTSAKADKFCLSINMDASFKSIEILASVNNDIFEDEVLVL